MVVSTSRSCEVHSRLLEGSNHKISPSSFQTNSGVSRSNSHGSSRLTSRNEQASFGSLPKEYQPYLPPGKELKKYCSLAVSSSLSYSVQGEQEAVKKFSSRSFKRSPREELGRRQSPVSKGTSIYNSPSSPDFFSPPRRRSSTLLRSKSTQQRKSKRTPRKSFSFETKVVKAIQQQTFGIIHSVEDQFRQATAKKRISGVLLNLRAASERNLEIEIEQRNIPSPMRKPASTTNQDNSNSNDENDEPPMTLRDMVGDVGLAIFSPLHVASLEEEALPDIPIINATLSKDDEIDDTPEDTEEYPVELLSESEPVIKACPRILTPQHMVQLTDEALPNSMRTMTWNRIYSVARDGDCFCAFLQKVSDYKHTIICIKTSEGDILGGYCTEAWKRQEGYNSGRAFFGSGESFLFSNHPSAVQLDRKRDWAQPSLQNTDRMHVFKWAGINTYSQVCDVDDGQIAMGGGGTFGLIVQDNFSTGATGRCSTFDNPPLVPASFSSPTKNNRENDKRFQIVDFEVYGFETELSIAALHRSTITLRAQ